MRGSRWRRVVEVLLAGWIMAGLYAAAASALGPASLVQLPYWATALGDVLVGVWLALLTVDLRRMAIEIAVSAGIATVVYFLLLLSAAASSPDYFVNLADYAIVQVVPVLFLSLFLALIGSLVGTVINASARGIEL